MAEKEHKTHGKKSKIILVIVLILIIISFIACSGSDNRPAKVSSTSSESTTDSSEEKTTSFTVGDTADFDGVQVTLSSAILSNGSEYIKPDDGKYYLGLIFDINNSSTKDITVSSIASFDAYVDDYSVNQDLGGASAPEWDGINQLDGSVAAGKRINGVIIYQVPQDFKNFEITFTPDFWDNKKVTFNIPAESVDRSSLQ